MGGSLKSLKGFAFRVPRSAFRVSVQGSVIIFLVLGSLLFAQCSTLNAQCSMLSAVFLQKYQKMSEWKCSE